MQRMKPLPLRDVKIDDPFWNRLVSLVREKVIPYQWEALNDRVPDAARSNCVKNFEIAAGRRSEEYYGMVFQDSDLYKWLESVAYSLETHPDAKLETLADGAIELIGAAQRPDGYLNTYYTVKEPQGRWTNLQQGHELYCAGHMIEAAVAYADATGKRAFLEIAVRFADCIDRYFGAEAGKCKGYPGHQEIELALVKLADATGERRYLKLAEFFLRERGTLPNYFDAEEKQNGYVEIFPELRGFDRGYSQSRIPPVLQKTAEGHAVRQLYMLSAMADLDGFETACESLYESITESQMYITGAVGSSSIGERFTGAYDLPNDSAYGETCASVALMMFARRMNAKFSDAKYADTMERALYNTVLAGMSVTGGEFFYVNPLEAEPERIRNNPGLKHVKPVRQKWFDCSCCPTNIARTVMGLGGYIYGASEDGLFVNLYCSGSVTDGGRKITVATNYPYGGEVTVKATGGRYKIFLRNPANATVVSILVNGKEQKIFTEKGYVALERVWQDDEVKLQLNMTPRLVYSHPSVQMNIRKAAVQRGPLVYCAEEADNGKGLGEILLPLDSKFEEIPAPEGLPPEAVALSVNAYRYSSNENALYYEGTPSYESAEMKMIPYFLWANRGENEMRVYVQAEPNKIF